jgi:hypothetical protein
VVPSWGLSPLGTVPDLRLRGDSRGGPQWCRGGDCPGWGLSPIPRGDNRARPRFGRASPLTGRYPAVRRSASAAIRRESTFDSPSAAIVTP